MVKIKPIMPSLREKKRYLAFEIISKNKLSPFSVKESLLSSIARFLGELNASKAGIMFLEDKYDEKSQKGLIKVSNKQLNNLKSALILTKKINNEEVIIRSIGVSGILKKASAKFVN